MVNRGIKMHNHLLDTFILVAEEKSINKASNKLLISPVSIMKQIRKLEDHLDVKLFNTSNKGSLLTKEGQKIYVEAKYIVSYSNKVKAKIKPLADITLKLGIPYFNSVEPFLDLWNLIQTKYKNIKFELVPIHENKLIFKSLYNLNVDLLVGIYDAYEKPKCEFLQLGTCKQMLIVPKKHPLANHKVIKITDFRKMTVYIPKKGLFVSTDKLVEDIKTNIDSITFIETKTNANFSKIMNDALNNNIIFFATDSLNNIYPDLVSIPLTFGKDIPYCLFYDKKLFDKYPELLKILDVFKKELKKHKIFPSLQQC